MINLFPIKSISVQPNFARKIIGYLSKIWSY